MDEKKRKILLVDDDRDLMEMYTEMFQAQNFDVLEAFDGMQGLDIAIKEVPDVIFTGIIMPGMDGFAMMEALKKVVMTANIPVVISSHMGREEDKEKAKNLGARDFIVKGYTKPAEIVERVEALFVDSDKTYDLDLDVDSDEVKKLIQDLNFSDQLKCAKCGGRMRLKLKLSRPVEKIFEARFFCADCGEAAK